MKKERRRRFIRFFHASAKRDCQVGEGSHRLKNRPRFALASTTSHLDSDAFVLCICFFCQNPVSRLVLLGKATVSGFTCQWRGVRESVIPNVCCSRWCCLEIACIASTLSKPKEQLRDVAISTHIVLIGDQRRREMLRKSNGDGNRQK